MTTDPTITAEDRELAEEIEPPLQTEYPLEKIERDRRVVKNAAIIARHREQQKQNALDDFLEDLTEAFGVEWNENPETGLRPTAFSASEALEYAKHLCELEQREKTIGRVKHCDRCGSDWADNGINSGCPCDLLAELDEIDRLFERRNTGWLSRLWEWINRPLEKHAPIEREPARGTPAPPPRKAGK